MLAAGYVEKQAVEQLEYAADRFLVDGAVVAVRRARLSDVARIQEMHSRLSRESLYYRYLAPRMPDREELQRLCFLDGGAGLAIVAAVQERVVAMACFCVVPGDPSRAEPAILVEDGYQGCGLGKGIFLALCRQAREMGVETFECFTHPENRRVLSLIRGCGLRWESRTSGGVREIRVWLEAA